jgi:hypothetical protein
VVDEKKTGEMQLYPSNTHNPLNCYAHSIPLEQYMSDLPEAVEAPWRLHFVVLVKGSHKYLSVQPGDALQVATTAQTSMAGAETHLEGRRYYSSLPLSLSADLTCPALILWADFLAVHFFTAGGPPDSGQAGQLIGRAKQQNPRATHRDALRALLYPEAYSLPVGLALQAEALTASPTTQDSQETFQARVTVTGGGGEDAKTAVRIFLQQHRLPATG